MAGHSSLHSGAEKKTPVSTKQESYRNDCHPKIYGNIKWLCCMDKFFGELNEDELEESTHSLSSFRHRHS